MTVIGELSGLDGAKCSGCKRLLQLEVCHSFAGYYLGYICPECGPWSRETGYFSTYEEAEKELGKEIPKKLR